MIVLAIPSLPLMKKPATVWISRSTRAYVSRRPQSYQPPVHLRQQQICVSNLLSALVKANGIIYIFILIIYIYIIHTQFYYLERVILLLNRATSVMYNITYNNLFVVHLGCLLGQRPVIRSSTRGSIIEWHIVTKVMCVYCFHHWCSL